MKEQRADFELLKAFARDGDQRALAEAIRRHLDLVYATALRKVNDAGAAEEISQNVFCTLARKAWRFAPDDSLPAWLHKTALLESKAWLRSELRRRRRERTAAVLGTTMKTQELSPALGSLVPLLDEALLSLREQDRTALLLRYYECQSLREVGLSLGIEEDAAQKRMAKALEKLAAFFQRRGFKSETLATIAAALNQTAASTPAATASSVTRAALRTAAPMFAGCRNAFPIPGQGELLVLWLALCPLPELPLIDTMRMRRFINLPDCRPKVFNAPENEGRYEAIYLAPERAFLSELLVTNNGFGIELNVDKNSLEDEGRILRYGAPFQNGFTELQYNVIESTNLHGIRFPVRAVCKHFVPNWERKDPNDLRVWLQSELTVTRISFAEQGMAGRIVAPARMISDDVRPGVNTGYFVDDDQWKPVSDPEITRRARIARQRMGDSE